MGKLERYLKKNLIKASFYDNVNYGRFHAIYFTDKNSRTNYSIANVFKDHAELYVNKDVSVK